MNTFLSRIVELGISAPKNNRTLKRERKLQEQERREEVERENERLVREMISDEATRSTTSSPGGGPPLSDGHRRGHVALSSSLATMLRTQRSPITRHRTGRQRIITTTVDQRSPTVDQRLPSVDPFPSVDQRDQGQQRLVDQRPVPRVAESKSAPPTMDRLYAVESSLASSRPSQQSAQREEVPLPPRQRPIVYTPPPLQPVIQQQPQVYFVPQPVVMTPRPMPRSVPVMAQVSEAVDEEPEVVRRASGLDWVLIGLLIAVGCLLLIVFTRRK